MKEETNVMYACPCCTGKMHMRRTILFGDWYMICDTCKLRTDDFDTKEALEKYWLARRDKKGAGMFRLMVTRVEEQDDR